jgi:hypothetical protein
MPPTSAGPAHADVPHTNAGRAHADMALRGDPCDRVTPGLPD